MGMGYACSFAEVIEQETVVKFCPKEFKKLTDTLGETSFAIEDVARCVSYMDFSEVGEKIKKAFYALTKAFNKKTGLALYMGYHDAESEGDRYDEVDGAFWAVEGMYKLSPAGKKMDKFVSRKFWVTFG